MDPIYRVGNLLDERTGAMYTVDTFGAILPGVPESCDDVSEADLVDGIAGWGAFDSPWTQLVDHDRFRAAASEVARLQPTTIVSSHLPSASGCMAKQFVEVIASVPACPPFVPPDHAAFASIFAALGAAAPTPPA